MTTASIGGSSATGRGGDTKRRRSQPGDRAGGVGPDRIGEERHVVHLHQDARVAHPRDAGEALPGVVAEPDGVGGDHARRAGPGHEGADHAAGEER